MRSSELSVIIAIIMAAGLVGADHSFAADVLEPVSKDGESATSQFTADASSADNDFDLWVQQGRPEYKGLGEPDETALRKCRKALGIEGGLILTLEWIEPYHCFYHVNSKQFTALSADWNTKAPIAARTSAAVEEERDFP